MSEDVKLCKPEEAGKDPLLVVRKDLVTEEASNAETVSGGKPAEEGSAKA